MKVKKMGKENLYGRMAVFIMENFKKIIFMEKAFIVGMMEESMMANGN